ncbi:MAG: Hsp70 family protein [Ruminiclostridium sp.]|nr:Hsp70 family protein [Ruminiclostridium sp.]
MKIGIDLGTTNTLVSYVNKAGNVCKISFRNGRIDNPHLLPSCIAATDNGVVVGQPALDMEKNNPELVLRDTKYYIGTDKSWMLGRQSVDAGFVAEQILKEVMSELRRQFPDEIEFHAFITVPARFDTQAPRQATKDALARAGFRYNETNALTDEPIAAAVAYSRELDNTQNVLVVDFGGGTFDLSLLRSTIIGFASSENSLEPIAWGGDLYLGGNDVDEILAKLLADKVMEETGRDLSHEPRYLCYSAEESMAASVLRESIINLKKQLYSEDSETAELYIPELLQDYDLSVSITLDEYEKALQEISDRMRNIIKNIYDSNNLAFEETDKVLVVGGMAKERCLLKILREIFGAEKILIPEESLYLVSRGAAICNSNARIHVDNKAYSSIGVLIKNLTDVDVIVREGQSIGDDFRVVRYYYPHEDKAFSLTINIVEYVGEFNPRNYNIVHSSSIVLRKRLFAKEQKIEAEFTLDRDNLLSVNLTQVDGSKTRVSVRV